LTNDIRRLAQCAHSLPKCVSCLLTDASTTFTSSAARTSSIHHPERGHAKHDVDHAALEVIS
jgi:hypothetical protein